MPPTDCGNAVELISTDCAIRAGVAMLLEASTGGVDTVSIWSGLMFARNSGVMVPLPELTASAKLLIGSTAIAPLSTIWIGVVVPDGVKLAVAWVIWPVSTMVTRSPAEGSNREIWLLKRCIGSDLSDTTGLV